MRSLRLNQHRFWWDQLLDNSGLDNSGLNNSGTFTQLSRLRSIAAPESQLRQLSPAALAYLGDGVYELYVRSVYLLPQRAQAYHQKVVAQVRAESQALQLAKILPDLTPTELDLVRRGRNAVKKIPKRLTAEVYQQATSLETLIGYLYLQDIDRLLELLSKFDW